MSLDWKKTAYRGCCNKLQVSLCIFLSSGNIKAAFSACVTLKDHQKQPMRQKKAITEAPARPNSLSDSSPSPLSPTDVERQVRAESCKEEETDGKGTLYCNHIL